MRGEPVTVAVNGFAVTMCFVLQSTGWSPPTDAQPIRRSAHSTATVTARRPFHEAVSRQARRARHSRQVFGLTGMHRLVLLLAVASRSCDQCCKTAVVPAYRCGTVPDSHRVPSYEAHLTCFARCRLRRERRDRQTDCEVEITWSMAVTRCVRLAIAAGGQGFGDGQVTVVEVDGPADRRVVVPARRRRPTRHPRARQPFLHSAPTSIRPVAGSSVRRPGPSTVQSRSRGAKMGVRGRFRLGVREERIVLGDTPWSGPAPKYDTITNRRTPACPAASITRIAASRSTA